MPIRFSLSPRNAFFLSAMGFALAGAVAGAQIGRAPILSRDRGEGVSTADTAVYVPVAENDSRALPDHYPLVTPEGTIPVAALSEHGLFRNRSNGWWDDAGYPTDVAPPDYQYSKAEIDHLATADLALADQDVPSAQAPRQATPSQQMSASDKPLNLDKPAVITVGPKPRNDAVKVQVATDQASAPATLALQ